MAASSCLRHSAFGAGQDRVRPWLQTRVSFETNFDSKQPKLEPKLVSALSETKCLFWLFQFYTKTESFGVSIVPKQTIEQPEQFDREHWYFFRKFRFVMVCFETVCSGCFASIPKQRVSIF